MTFPVVLKTAVPGITHKTDRQGVIPGIETAEELAEAYAGLAARLGPRALVAPMVDKGIEMILGARRDPQFGPVILLGFGGIHAEVQKDVVFALPPFDTADARRKTDRLRMRPLLDGKRGNTACDVESYCEAAARFSAMVHALGDCLQEVDVNPLIVTADGCIAVDALVAGAQRVQEG